MMLFGYVVFVCYYSLDAVLLQYSNTAVLSVSQGASVRDDVLTTLESKLLDFSSELVGLLTYNCNYNVNNRSCNHIC